MNKSASKFATAVRTALSLFAATAICSCSNHPNSEQPVIDPVAKRTVKVTAHTPDYGDDTRVTFSPKDRNGYYTRWSGNEEFVMAEYIDGSLSIVDYNKEIYIDKDDVTVKEDGRILSFQFQLSDFQSTDESVFQYYLIHPNSVFEGGQYGFYDYLDEKSFIAELPYNQTQTEEGTADNEAVIMFAQSEMFDEQPEELSVHFEHIVSYGHLLLKNVGSGEKINRVKFTAADHKLSGQFEYFWEKDEDEKYYIEDGNSNNGNPKNYITVNVSAISADDDGILNVWFATLPTDIITNFTVSATTVDNKTYTTNVSVPADKNFGFKAGRVSKFGIDMSGVAAE